MSLDVRLEHCAKTFPDGTVALAPIDVHVRAGETLVLLGPSGCGKTTTLRIIAGLERPDPHGRVFYGADDVTPLPIERRNVGMVFQSYALFPNMTVAQNVAYGLKVRGIEAGEQRRRTGAMLELVQIGELAERRIDQLSGGQRQRVALARAIAVEPKVLLLDEPLAALDAKLREHLRIEIDAILRRVGITAIYVTHDQAEAMVLGDRIVVMERGRIAQMGTPREIYHHPASRFVAEFVGTMNRLPLDGGIAYARPEDVRVTTNGEARWRGRIAGVAFLGDRVRLSIEGVGESTCFVDASTRDEFRLGDEVALSVDAGALVRFAQ